MGLLFPVQCESTNGKHVRNEALFSEVLKGSDYGQVKLYSCFRINSLCMGRAIRLQYVVLRRRSFYSSICE